MSKWKSRLDIAASIAILCVCVLIGVIGVKKFLLGDSHHVVSLLKNGSRIELAGVDWSHADRTIVLALSTHCHFCDDSSGFYQRLLPVAGSAGVPVVAVFPQSVDEARAHWAAQHLPLSGIVVLHAPAGQLSISGTPTVILVNSKGVVLRAWTGEQSASGEAEIVHAVQR